MICQEMVSVLLIIGSRENLQGTIVQKYDQTIPILPARSIPATIAFYRQLGFEGGARDFNQAYAILTRGSVELHFFQHPSLIPENSYAGCYIRVADVQSIYRDFALIKLPKAGIPRMERLENKPWGLKEFALLDTDGNLIRIGEVIKE